MQTLKVGGHLLSAVLARLDRGDAGNGKWPDAKGEYHALCPFHDDHHASNFSVSERGYKCFACDAKGGLRALARHLGVEVARAEATGCTLARYAAAKRLSLEFLRGLGLKDVRWYGRPAVEIPYQNERGQVVARRVRKALSTPDRFRWRKGARTKGLLYGLWRLPAIREAGWALLVEGESDAHTAWLKGLPCLGVPGADMWAGSAAKHLGGLEVFVWREPDLAGTGFVRAIARDLPRARVLASAEFKDLSDAHVAGQDVVALVERLKTEAVPIRQAVEGTLPEIETLYRPLRDQTARAMRALEAANQPPVIFWRAGRLARVGRDENGLAIISGLTESALRGKLARCVEFTKRLRGGSRKCAPPLDVVRDIMALGQWPEFPSLLGVTEIPILRSDGTILAVPGYDPASKLYYAPSPGLKIPAIADEPTAEQVDEAASMLIEPIRQFPFDGDASFANALAAILTPILRPMIAGLVPMALFDKPQAGTGASLLAEVVATIVTGRPAAMMSAPRDDEGWRKRITSMLIRGATVAVVDNIEGRFYAPSLAAVLTAKTWEDRILGESRMIALPHRIVWIATGNNVRLGGDLPRRCYWVRMDAKEARPWQRTGFTHQDLVAWTLAHRGELLAAALTLARAWIAAGKPKAEGLPVLGGFTVWSETIGGVLSCVRGLHFLGNLSEMYDEMDQDTVEWEGFLTAWREVWNDEEVTAAEFAKSLPKRPALAEALPTDLTDAWIEGKSFNRQLGAALSKMKDVHLPCGLYVHKGKKEARSRSIMWSVRSVEPNCGDAESSESTWYRGQGEKQSNTSSKLCILGGLGAGSDSADSETPQMMEASER